MWTVRQIHLLFHSTDIQQTARNAAAGPHHEASPIRQRFHQASHRGLRQPKATNRRALYRPREPHREFGIEPLPDDPDVRQIELSPCLRQECRLPFTRFDKSHRPFGMKRRKHQPGKPGATADIEKPGLTAAFSHRGSPVHPGRERLRVVPTNPLRRLRFTDQPDHPVPAFQELGMTRQPINRLRRQLVAKLSLKQITVFHVKHLRVSGVGVSRETREPIACPASIAVDPFPPHGYGEAISPERRSRPFSQSSEAAETEEDSRRPEPARIFLAACGGSGSEDPRTQRTVVDVA